MATNYMMADIYGQEDPIMAETSRGFSLRQILQIEYFCGGRLSRRTIRMLRKRFPDPQDKVGAFCALRDTLLIEQSDEVRSIERGLNTIADAYKKATVSVTAAGRAIAAIIEPYYREN